MAASFGGRCGDEINPAEVKLVWFCAEHRFAQHYADASSAEVAL
jgi:hypothetical protein